MARSGELSGWSFDTSPWEQLIRPATGFSPSDAEQGISTERETLPHHLKGVGRGIGSGRSEKSKRVGDVGEPAARDLATRHVIPRLPGRTL